MFQKLTLNGCCVELVKPLISVNELSKNMQRHEKCGGIYDRRLYLMVARNIFDAAQGNNIEGLERCKLVPWSLVINKRFCVKSKFTNYHNSGNIDTYND